MIENLKEKSLKPVVILIILLAIALLSNLVIAKKVTDPSFYAETIESLDAKKGTVVKLAAASVASSTALSLIPGDGAMPIANQMAELSKYFLIILSAILLEKMLIAVVGSVTFSYIIPAACFLGGLYILFRLDVLRNLAIKLAIFGIVIFIAIPTSVKISDLIYSSHQASLEQTVQSVEENNEYIEEKKNQITEEDKGLLEKFGNYLSDLTSKVGIGITDMIKKGEDSFNEFLDAIAVLIITTCVIPLIVILIFAWSIKILFNFEIKVPKKMLTTKQFLEND